MSESMPWKKINSSPFEAAHYSIMKLDNGDESGMEALRIMFPTAEADDMNFVIFSTSGIHGSYNTIEQAENPDDEDSLTSVTFLIVHPRIVCLRFGNCCPKTAEDFAYLKKLRSSSALVMGSFGVSESCEWKRVQDWNDVWDIGCDKNGFIQVPNIEVKNSKECKYCGKPLVVKDE